MADEPVHATLNVEDGLRTTLSTRLHTWTSDGRQSDELPDPVGPNPFVQLLGALASCMIMTVRLYAVRKGWTLERVSLDAVGHRPEASPLERVDVTLRLEGDLDEEQRDRILHMAQRCPVHRTLAPVVDITTSLEPVPA